MNYGGTSTLDIPWAALAPVLVLLVGFVIYCWVDIARHAVKHLPKWGWAIICAASIPIGGIVYLLIGRDDARTS
jgi:predicted ABC-type exoprotein transport system permease subunit